MTDTRRISRLLSLMLRHRPDEFGLAIDEYGFVPLDQVVQAVQERYAEVSEEDILRLVQSPTQRRFELDERGIRALYGHSFFVEMDGDPMQPPERLYMGSTAGAARRYNTEGITPGDRFYVHLSLTQDAAAARSREPGGPVVVEVKAADAAASGVEFHERGEVVLTREVPARFVAEVHGLAAGATAAAAGWQKPDTGQVSYGRKPRRDRRR